MIYTYGVEGQQERYLAVTKAIAEYAAVKHSKELWTLITEKTEASFTEPPDPGDTVTRAQLEK